MSMCIKKVEWICNNQKIIKIESINSYMNDVLSTKTVDLPTGQLVFDVVEAGDMQLDEEFASIVLLDNTDYWMSYESQSELIDKVVFENLLSQRVDNHGILNSKNYVGTLDIGKFDFSIIVKSKKTNYDRDYNFLKNSISEFYDDLLSRSSSYYSEHFCKSDEYAGEKINYSELAYLKEMLQPNMLPAWLDYLVYHAEHKYQFTIEVQRVTDVEEIDVDFFLKALQGEDLFKTSKMRGKLGEYGYAPQEVDIYVAEQTYDTNENKFVKFFVQYIRDYLNELLDNADQVNSKLCNEIKKMIVILEDKLEHPFWRKISHLENIPFNSQILQKKYPYNMIFQMYTDFSMKSQVALGDVDRKYFVGQKDAPMLYQYWVFIMLFQYLAKKYSNDYITSDWLTYDGKNLSFSLREGRKSYAVFNTSENRKVKLIYNKTYDHGHTIYEGRSYSHELKPDISLELFRNDELLAIVHFDAKYRLPINGSDVPDDINKMHAYKDGILGTVGSFAICLGDNPIIYHEEEKGWEKDDIFPAVGACPLNLNSDTLENELGYIYKIVDSFVSLDAENIYNSFSRERLEAYASLARRMMKMKEK